MTENGQAGHMDPGVLRIAHSGLGSQPDPRTEIPELGFRDYWYPVVGLEKLRRRRPVRVRLLGDDLCVFQGRSGPAVISDICPHRGASVAGGICHYEGTVSCPYHGWTFDERGECVAVLSEGPNSLIPGKVRIRRYPTRVVKGVLFAWMGQGEPTPLERDLPPELFDDSVVVHDATKWQANWRPALENMNDNHVRYTHRNSLMMLLRPFGKTSFAGAKAIISGGGATLTSYTDDSLATRPYQEYFPGVDGLWPKHRYRLLWSWLFNYRPTRWLAYNGRGEYQQAAKMPYNVGPSEHVWEWNQGVHMPGMMRINMGGVIYTRWCVPVDRHETRLFYFYATRVSRRTERWWFQWVKNPITYRALHNRNLGFQDGRILEQTRFDAAERFSFFDIETTAWRRLAILSSRYGGRHDRIPPDIIDRLNGPAMRALGLRDSNDTVSLLDDAEEPVGTLPR